MVFHPFLSNLKAGLPLAKIICIRTSKAGPNVSRVFVGTFVFLLRVEKGIMDRSCSLALVCLSSLICLDIISVLEGAALGLDFFSFFGLLASIGGSDIQD